MEIRIDEMAADCNIKARRHIIQLAREGGLNEMALHHAKALALMEPNDPLAREVLGWKASSAGT